MHDENHHKDPLERLFYKKATKYVIPFREEDWLNLEKRLDVQDMKRSYERKFLFLAAASLLIFALFGYFTFDNYNRLNQLSNQLESETLPDTQNYSPVDRFPATPLFQSPSDAIGGEIIDKSESASTFEATVQKPVNVNATLDHNLRPLNGSMEHRMLEVELINPSYLELEYLSDLKELRSPSVSKELFYIDRSANMSIADQDPMGSGRLGDGLSSPFKASRLGIGLAISPDKSSAGMTSKYGETGYRIGIKGEYRLSDNLFLTAGILASSVNYSTRGSRYNPPEFLNNGVNPDRTTALCLILDIPLGIKYNVINFDKSSLFATAGLSSYIMLNEDYQFEYETDYSSYESTYEVKNGSRHLFNNIGLSVGYELNLFSKWNLRAEPFINIPLNGVGWGDVKLYSVGSYVSINYQL